MALLFYISTYYKWQLQLFHIITNTFIICHLIVVILAVVKWYPFVVLIYISPSWLMMLNIFACVYSPFSTFYGEISIWIFFPLSLFFSLHYWLVWVIYIFVCHVPLETVWYKISPSSIWDVFSFFVHLFSDLSVCLSGQFCQFSFFSNTNF